MNTSVNVLAVLHDVLGDLMAAQIAGVDTDTTVQELSDSIDAVAELIEASKAVSNSCIENYGNNMALHLQLTGYGGLNERLAAALAQVRGDA